MEDDAGRSRRRSIKTRQFSPEPEPSKKTKQKQVSRLSTGSQKTTKSPQNLILPTPQAEVVSIASSPQPNVISGNNKVVLKLNLGPKPTISTPTSAPKKSNGVNSTKSSQKKENSTSSAKNGSRLKLAFDSDEDFETEPPLSLQEIERIAPKHAVPKAPAKFESKSITPVASRPETPTIAQITEIIEREKNRNVSPPIVVTESPPSLKNEKTASDLVGPNEQPEEPPPAPQGKTVLVGKNFTPVHIAAPNIAERRSVGGRSRKPPPSKEYDPDSDKKPVTKKRVSLPKLHSAPQPQKPVSVFSELFPDHATPSSTPVTTMPFPSFSVFSSTPSSALISSPQPAFVTPLTPAVQPAESMDVLRPGRNKAKNLSELAPSLLPKKEQAKLLRTPAILSHPKQTPYFNHQSVFKFPAPRHVLPPLALGEHAAVAVNKPLSISKPSPIPRIQKQASAKIESSPEVESPIDQGDPEVILYFGDAITYLKNLNPRINEWLAALEETLYKGDFFRRALFLEGEEYFDVVEKMIPEDEEVEKEEPNDEDEEDDEDEDPSAKADLLMYEQLPKPQRIQRVPVIPPGYQRDDVETELDVLSIDPVPSTSMFQTLNILHQTVEPYAERLKMLYPGKRTSFYDLDRRIVELKKVVMGKQATAEELLAKMEVIKKLQNYKSQTAEERKAKAKLTADRVRLSKSDAVLQKLDLARCMGCILEIIKDQYRMELVFGSKDKGVAAFYCFTLQNAERMKTLLFQNFSKVFVGAHEILLCSLEFEPLCSYLNVLRFLKASGTTSGTFFISHASAKFERGKNVVSEVLNLKVRDPYHRLLAPSSMGRKVKAKNVYLLVVYPGVYDETLQHKPIFQSHESIFRQGLTNIGAFIEKVTVRKRFEKPASTVELAEWSVTFLKDKLREVTLRRSRDRIFVASWGTTCLHVHEAALTIDGISGIIDFSMPLISPLGSRGAIGDSIVYTYCPTLLVVGEKASLITKSALRTLRDNMIVRPSLLTVGKADDYLHLPPAYMAANGITPACVNKLIMEHVIDFIDKVMVCTKQDTHTKHLEVPDLSAVIVDMNAMLLDDFEDNDVEVRVKRIKSPSARRSREPKRRRTESSQQKPRSFQSLQQHAMPETELEYTTVVEVPEYEGQSEEPSDGEGDGEEEEEEEQREIEPPPREQVQQQVVQQQYERVETPMEYDDEDLDREAQEAAAALENNFDEEEDYY